MIWPFNLFFVSRKQYAKLRLENIDLEIRLLKSRIAENDAVKHALDAECRMRAAELRQPRSPFDDATLRKLISLCHPDRHGGKQSAQEMTAMLIEMRNANR